ncbi:MAG: class I SAM-dependent methyltransferase [Actinomycetota bacterium]|nr:class I SAM-dependent methyltransferase [Actinomycetota bacterium]
MSDKLPTQQSNHHPVPCHICDAITIRTRHGSAGFLECPGCGYAVLAQDPARADYWSHSHYQEAAGVDFWIPAKRRYFEAALRLLEQETPGRRLLDVGGGVGFFAELALARGWDAYSLDISPRATQLASERIGSRRALNSLDTIKLASFDVASLWCVVAHTRDPNDLIASTSRLLRPGGLIWLTTPNFDFQKAYATLRSALHRPIDFAVDDHVSHFTPQALLKLLGTHGFNDLSLHLCGITEVCSLTLSENKALVSAKWTFNRLAFGLTRLGVRNYVSELQVSGRFDPRK